MIYLSRLETPELILFEHQLRGAALTAPWHIVLAAFPESQELHQVEKFGDEWKQVGKACYRNLTLMALNHTAFIEAIQTGQQLGITLEVVDG